MKIFKKVQFCITFLGGLIILSVNLNVLSMIKGGYLSKYVTTGNGNVSSNQCNNSHIVTDKKIIFILAYYRSGSSFTGSIFKQYPGTFYLFEPIRKVYHMYERGFDSRSHELTYISGDARLINNSNGLQVIYEEIDNWLNCNIGEISIESILDNRHLISAFRECEFTYSTDLMGRNIVKCISAVSQSCRIAKVKVFKFVRLRVKHVLDLLDKYPNMKIIHLVRDPRGIFNSRFEIGPTQQLFTLLAQKHCSEVNEDISFSLQIFKKCPSKVRIIQFEKIAEVPEEATRVLFNFTGMYVTKDTLKYLKKQTNADSDSGQYGLSRQNANLTVNKWRYSLDLRTANQLYMFCRKSNVILGYLPLSTLFFLRNYSVPSRKLSFHRKEIFI